MLTKYVVIYTQTHTGLQTTISGGVLLLLYINVPLIDKELRTMNELQNKCHKC